MLNIEIPGGSGRDAVATLSVVDDGTGDAELVRRFARGDAESFDQLYRRHRDFVLRVARRYCGSRDEALDVLQETFAWLIRKAPGLQLRHRLPTLLYPVARNLARDHRRRRDRAPLPLADDHDVAASPSPALEGRDDIGPWLEGLGPLHREILTLRFADELDLQEIAAALGVPLGTVKSRLHNALRLARERHGHA